MKEKQREIWRKWFRRDNLIVMILLGILLFIIALPTKKGGEESKNGAGNTGDRDGDVYSRTAGGTGEESRQASAGGAASGYAREQEEKLTEILSAMEGVGRVKVMLTIAVSEELVVEKDSKVSRANVDERDSVGGSRVSAQLETGDTTVYAAADGNNMPYVVKTLNPRVEGVLVVAEGAGNGTLNRQIVQIVQALFGVEAHRVKVVPMEQKQGRET